MSDQPPPALDDLRLCAWELGFGPSADRLSGHPLTAEAGRAREGAVEVGWCGGDGPGIATHRWPRSRVTGFPLLHVLTMRLPAPYRRRGPELTGIAYFASSETFLRSEIADLLAAEAVPEQAAARDPFLRGLADYFADRHPHEELRTDILGSTHALVRLTDTELAGRSTAPDRHLPAGVGEGNNAAADWGDSAWFRTVPAVGLWLAPRQDDPNTGKAPTEDPSVDGYVQAWELVDAGLASEEQLDAWSSSHLGGTCFPVQAMPADLTPWYLELEDDVAGVNYGGGLAQIDLESATFDWACG